MNCNRGLLNAYSERGWSGLDFPAGSLSTVQKRLRFADKKCGTYLGGRDNSLCDV